MAMYLHPIAVEISNHLHLPEDTYKIVYMRESILCMKGFNNAYALQ